MYSYFATAFFCGLYVQQSSEVRTVSANRTYDLYALDSQQIHLHLAYTMKLARQALFEHTSSFYQTV